MKDWNNLIPDKILWLNKHFSRGRRGSIRAIVLHHNAGNLSLQGCWDTWQTREASAHYQVDINGQIAQYVRLSDTAWHAGPANSYTIGIEHADAYFAPTWSIGEATLDNGAHLVAALCYKLGLGVPTWGVNVYPHNHFMDTGCPGAIAGAQRDLYMSRAKDWYLKMTNHIEEKPKEADEMLLKVDNKWWFQTEGCHARGVSDPDLLTKMTKVMPIIEITSQQLRDNWIVFESSEEVEDFAKAPLRTKSNNQLLTNYKGMPDWMKKSSILQAIFEKVSQL